MMDIRFPDRLRAQLRLERAAGNLDKIVNPKLPSGFQFPNMDPLKARKGAVLILFYLKEDQWYFPLIQRPKYEGVHSGQVAFPGGRMEEGDETLIRTAIRETTEEIGVAGNEVEVIDSISDFFVAASNHLVRPVIGLYPSVPEFIPDNREVETVIEAPVSELMQQAVSFQEIKSPRGYSLISPSFIFDDRVVWGATAMMLTELKRILREMDI